MLVLNKNTPISKMIIIPYIINHCALKGMLWHFLTTTSASLFVSISCTHTLLMQVLNH